LEVFLNPQVTDPEGTEMKVKRIVVGVALATVVAACGEVEVPLLPAGPSYDGGGHTLGSGGRSTDTTTTTTTTTSGGGHTLGSGG
jgi:ABC-type glycerol-3-phosphate transport system substrate-binding protein